MCRVAAITTMATTTSPALRHGLHFYDAIRGRRPDRPSKSAPKIWLLIPKGKTVISACERDCPRNGRQGNHRVSVSAPMVAIVPEYARITFDSNDEMPGIMIALASQVLKEASRSAFGSLSCAVPSWLTAWDPFLRELADSLVRLRRFNDRDFFFPEAFAHVLALHLVCRYGRCVGAPAHDTGRAQQMLTAIDIFIREHIDETIRVEQLADLVHMSPSHFARAFKAATGCSPHSYLTNERLKFARSMLSEGGLPLTDVAARAGFQTQQYFTEVFRRYTGSTPRAFRLAHNASTMRERTALPSNRSRPG
jgi:AraC family transcriptional regulator